ncbi:MAG: hypothetical protein AAF843_10305 [Bacteroidota bacterium]
MIQHPYIQQKGFTTNGHRITYEVGETISFSANYLLSQADAFEWNLYHADTGLAITTLLGANPTWSPLTTYKQGIDVELKVNFGIHQTVFKKRIRLVIIPNCNTPDFTIDISQGFSDPRISDAGNGQWNVDGTGIPGGSVVHFIGTASSSRIRLLDFQGTDGNEIMICSNGVNVTTINKTGSSYDDALIFLDRNEHVWLYGRQLANNDYGMRLNDGGLSAAQFGPKVESHHNIRVFGLRAEGCQSSGIKLKLDFVNRSTGAFDDLWVYDCYTADCANEGIYLGFFNYAYDSGFNGGDYHHSMKRCKMFYNYATNNGWDGVQLSCADEDAEVFGNYSYKNATSNTGSQNFELVLNGGFTGQCYDNLCVGNAMQILVNGDSYVYNNIIYAPSRQNAIFVRRTDNPGLGSPSFDHNDPNAVLYLFNNTLVSAQDPVYILDANDRSTGSVPIDIINLYNNLALVSGGVVEGFMRYNEPGTNTINQDNQTVANESAIGFEDAPNDDFDIADSSSNILSEAMDISSVVDIDNLKLKLFTDAHNQYAPIRGRWRYGAHHRTKNHETLREPDKTKSMIQWYQTNETSGFTDREKIPEAYGAIFKTSDYIDNSAKPRKLMSALVKAKTGEFSGVEQLDDASFS